MNSSFDQLIAITVSLLGNGPFPHLPKTSPWPVLLRRFAQAVAQTLVKQPDFGVVDLEMASDFPRNVSWHFGHRKKKSQSL